MKRITRALGGGIALVASLAMMGAVRAPGGAAQVDGARLANPGPNDWPGYGGSYAETRFSQLAQINAGTIGKLSLAWAVDLDTHRGQEATPIVVDGIMYVSTAWSKVMAIDAATGRVLWKFDPHVIGGKAVHACCDVVNRGVAVWKGKVLFGTIDGRLIALDAASGKQLWSVVTVDQSKPYTITGAPRVFKDKVVIGNSGAELGVRGYVTAYDIATGKQVWRFYTVPGNPADGPDHAASDDILAKLASPTWHGQWWKYGGGGTVWDSMVYDPELDQLLLGVGNGSPWNHVLRSDGKGDNLFLSSILALDPDTGKYKWHYQETPGETWDFTATQQMTLATLDLGNGPRKVVIHAPKNGFVFIVDRTNGKLLSAKPYVHTSWASGYDMKTGRPIENPAARFVDAPALVTPSGIGAHAWMPMSYDPTAKVAYIPAMEVPMSYARDPNYVQRPGRWNTAVILGGPAPGLPDDLAGRRAAIAAMTRGTLIAWDVVNGRPLWKVEHAFPWNGGTLATAGGLVFQGDYAGQFAAYRARDGAKLWSYEAHRGIMAGAVTYRVRGEQYVAVMAGYGGSMGVAAPYPDRSHVMPNGQILVFKLGGRAKLPPFVPTPQPPANPAKDGFTPAQVAEGAKWYFAFCSICHGGPINPDLRRAGALSDRDAWKAVVIDGALEPNGMASFRDYLSPDQAETIRAYLSGQAAALKAGESHLGKPD
jgi:PQQ-dependent dehydrogenase (methanol/ethanol family)